MVDTPTTHYGWIMPGDHVNANTWGAQNNSNWASCDAQVYANATNINAIQSQLTPNSLSLARTASVNATIALNNSAAPAGQQLRWFIYEDDVVESGGNAASDFRINAYSDTGSLLSTPLTIVRATGNAIFGSVLTVNGAVGVNGAATFDSTLLAYGAATFGGTVQVNGTATFNGTGTFNSTLSVAQAVYPSLANNANWYFGVYSGLEINNWNSGWNDYWRVSDGLRGWTGPSGQLMNLGGDGTLTIMGQAWKPGGGPWQAPSDDRIKNVIGEYESGLNEVLQLRPVVYTYKGNDTPTADFDLLVPSEERKEMVKATEHSGPAPYPASLHYNLAKEGKQFVGFVAQELETVFPDMVSKNAGFIDGQAVSDLRGVDTSELIFALVNSVKALKAEIEALKAAR